MTNTIAQGLNDHAKRDGEVIKAKSVYHQIYIHPAVDSFTNGSTVTKFRMIQIKPRSYEAVIKIKDAVTTYTMQFITPAQLQTAFGSDPLFPSSMYGQFTPIQLSMY